MEKLPHDIKFDIFSRLPAESILPYKLVCKSWLSLLNDPCFAQIHLRRQLFLLRHHYLKHDDAPYGGVEFGFILLAEAIDCNVLLNGKYDENDEQPCKIVNKIDRSVSRATIFKVWPLIGSCNGLICLSLIHGNVYGDPTYIFNPITGEYVNLPRLFSSKSYSVGRPIMSGFGYHPSTNEYKVVRIFHPYPGIKENVGQVQVYTLGARSGWRDKGEIAYPFLSMFGRRKAIHANGKLHWLDLEKNILAFDLADEEFHIIASPPIVYLDGESDLDQKCTRQLCVLGGWLGLAHYVFSGMGSSSHVDIWLLKKKCTTGYDMNEQEHECWGWRKEFTIPMTDGYYDISLLALTKRGEVLFWRKFNNCIFRYDPKSGTIEKLVLRKGSFIDAIPHINSLVSLKALGERGAVCFFHQLEVDH